MNRNFQSKFARFAANRNVSVSWISIFQSEVKCSFEFCYVWKVFKYSTFFLQLYNQAMPNQFMGNQMMPSKYSQPNSNQMMGNPMMPVAGGSVSLFIFLVHSCCAVQSNVVLTIFVVYKIYTSWNKGNATTTTTEKLCCNIDPLLRWTFTECKFFIVYHFYTTLNVILLLTYILILLSGWKWR